MAAQTDYWTNKRNRINRAYNALPVEEYTQELLKAYPRHLEIIDEILADLGPELDDEQYTETTSWQYEAELDALDKKEEELEPIVEARIEAEQHAEFLRDIGMTQEQYDEHERKLAEDARNRRNARIRKLRTAS